MPRSQGMQLTVENNIPDFIEQSDARAMENLQAAAYVWRSGIVNNLTGEGGGRRYRVYGTGRYYTASAPGQPPASMTGRLRSNVHVEMDPAGKAALVGILAELDYARFLEKGTRYMAPRPFIQPSLEENMAEIRSTATGRWDS